MEKFLYRYPKDKIKLNAVLVYPNSYYIGMSNLGLHSVYHIFQSHPEVHCERAFMDDHAKKTKTVESGRELGLFDVVVFSISFETDLLNLIRALCSSGIEPLREKRQTSGPMVIVGGIGTTILPGYLAKIADLIVSGDAAITLPPIIDQLLKDKNRETSLHALENIGGIYPYYQIKTDTLGYHRDRERKEPVTSVILTDDTEFSGRGLLEISSSCLYSCAFCLVTKAYGDYFPFPAERILEAAGRFKGFTDKLGLVAATLSNHPDFKMIIRELNRMGFQLSFSAFRIEGLDDELMEMIIRNENRTLTIAPETASAELKKVIHKIIPNEIILNAVRKACAIGIKRLKLYFLIGLPGETQADMDGIFNLVKDIREISKEYGKTHGYLPEIIVDINPLIPKPLTIFAGQPMEEVASLKKKIIGLKNKLRTLGRTFVYGESPKNALLQYRIANHMIEMDELIRMAEGNGAY